MPKVSVIIPTYNYAQYAARAIDSVLAQTYKDFEIILVDDGSTDNTKEIMEKNYSEKVRYFYQDNRGPGAARNLGLRHVKGQFVVFLDADDYFFPENLETKIEIFENKTHIDWLFSNAVFVDQYENRIGSQSVQFRQIYDRNDFPSTNIFKKLLKHGNFICTSTLLIRKTCFDSIPHFDESQLMHQDYLEWLFLSHRYTNYHYIPFPLIGIRRHKASWGHNRLTALEQHLELCKKIEKLYRNELKQFIISWNKRVSDIYNQLGNMKLSAGKRKNARGYYLKSIMKCPYQKLAYRNLFRTF